MVGGLTRSHALAALAIVLFVANITQCRTASTQADEAGELAARVDDLAAEKRRLKRELEDDEDRISKLKRDLDEAQTETERARRELAALRANVARDRNAREEAAAERANTLAADRPPVPGAICARRGPSGRCAEWLYPIAPPAFAGPSPLDRLEGRQ